MNTYEINLYIQNAVTRAPELVTCVAIAHSIEEAYELQDLYNKKFSNENMTRFFAVNERSKNYDY